MKRLVLKRTMYEENIEVYFDGMYYLKVDGIDVCVKNSLDNIHGYLFHHLLYRLDDCASKLRIFDVFIQVFLFIDCVKQEMEVFDV